MNPARSAPLNPTVEHVCLQASKSSLPSTCMYGQYTSWHCVRLILATMCLCDERGPVNTALQFLSLSGAVAPVSLIAIWVLLQAKWANEGLMTDPLSVENGAIMSNASRWSLMIDPQLQGIKWIMNRELPNGLKIIQQSQAKYIDIVISCIESGTPLLMENLPEDIDAVLDPVIGKQTIKRGRNLILKIGDAEVEYDQNFR